MAATVTVKERFSAGPLYGVVAEVTGDTSYVSGGYAFTPGLLGLGTIVAVAPAGANTTLYSAVHDNVANKLAFMNGGSEASGNISAVKVKVIVLGR